MPTPRADMYAELDILTAPPLHANQPGSLLPEAVPISNAPNVRLQGSDWVPQVQVVLGMNVKKETTTAFCVSFQPVQHQDAGR